LAQNRNVTNRKTERHLVTAQFVVHIANWARVSKCSMKQQLPLYTVFQKTHQL